MVFLILFPTLDSISIPSSYPYVIKHPCLKNARQEEILAFEYNHALDIVPLPIESSVTGCKWIDSIKVKSNGSLNRYKVFLLAQRYKQEYRTDYEQTFSLVVKMTTIKYLLSVVAVHNWPFMEMGFKNAF